MRRRQGGCPANSLQPPRPWSRPCPPRIWRRPRTLSRRWRSSSRGRRGRPPRPRWRLRWKRLRHRRPSPPKGAFRPSRRTFPQHRRNLVPELEVNPHSPPTSRRRTRLRWPHWRRPRIQTKTKTTAFATLPPRPRPKPSSPPPLSEENEALWKSTMTTQRRCRPSLPRQLRKMALKLMLPMTTMYRQCRRLRPGKFRTLHPIPPAPQMGPRTMPLQPPLTERPWKLKRPPGRSRMCPWRRQRKRL
mmetsp:Transcript_41923/g.127124  ORF Transcript_41923/g.127124 Transcript_41923/m.127124 type:complete len:245 (-) Transcript_41923:823-1557(-)